MADTRLTVSVCVYLCLIGLCCAQRKVSTTFLNPPDCKGTEQCSSIGYTIAVGSSDTLHYLVTGFGVPTVMVLYTNTVKNPGLTVDWDSLLSGNKSEIAHSIAFSNKDVSLKYSYAVVFSRLIEYNDTRDDADISKYSVDSVAWNVYDFMKFTWENVTTTSNPGANIISLQAVRGGDLFQKNGSVTIQFSAFENSGREDRLPHLQYHDNITQIDFTVDNVWTNLSMSRFAIEMMVVGGDNSGMRIDETQSIDDEYTPGVFKIFNLLTRSQDENSGGFLQWKPVCYLKSKRARAVATFVKHYEVHGVDGDSIHQGWLNDSILFGYYGDGLLANTRTATNLSFGLSKDGGYTGTNYTSWSASVGYGMPPADVVSTLVIVVISIGLGLPVVIMLFGGIYVCCKKKKPEDKQLTSVSRDYQPIKD